MPRWTPESRKRHSALMKTRIKEWQPWQHSTGAKTVEGKARSSKNAYKHGHCSREARQEMKLVREVIHYNKQMMLEIRQAVFW